MDLIALILVGCLSGLAIVQIVFVWRFVQCLGDWKTPLLVDDDCRPAVVILCLRGSDPYLRDCLKGLLSQDYPNYLIKIVVDHVDDPSMRLVDELVSNSNPRNAERVEVQMLTRIETTCSLKCSSLVQVVEGLNDNVNIIAQLDADTIPHTTWLRELATGLQPAEVGVVTGNRWYMPQEPTTGALVRYAWNAAAVVQMYWYSIAWGGTLAIETAVIKEAGLVERWRRAFCEDTLLSRAVGAAGYRVRFVPALMMINREDCDIQGFYFWVRRQLLTARLYHPFWLAVLGHGFLTSAIPLASVIWVVSCSFSGHWTSALLLMLSLIAYQAVMTIMLPWMESAMRQIAAGRNENASSQGARSYASLLWIGLVMQGIYSIALVSCLVLRKVEWRGIEYDIAGSWGITMLGYRPHRRDSQESTRSSSL